jgi:hypothetical protein
LTSQTLFSSMPRAASCIQTMEQWYNSLSWQGMDSAASRSAPAASSRSIELKPRGLLDQTAGPLQAVTKLKVPDCRVRRSSTRQLVFCGGR